MDFALYNNSQYSQFTLILQSIEEDLKAKLVDHSNSVSQDDALEKTLSDARKVIVIYNNSHLTQKFLKWILLNN